MIDADGTVLGKYRKHHIPQVKGFWEKFYFRPGNLGWPVFDTAVGRVGVYICYDRHFPEGWRALGLAGAQIVYNPSATSRGLSSYLWKLEQPAAAVANEYFVAAINRVGVEEYGDNDFYGTSYFVDPRGQFVGDVGERKRRGARRPRPRPRPDRRGAPAVGVLPRPPSRRLRAAGGGMSRPCDSARAPPSCRPGWRSTTRTPSRSSGARVATSGTPQGNAYLDFFGGILTTMTAHALPEVTKAVSEQAGRIIHSSTLYLNRPMVELAEQIATVSAIPDAKVFLTTSGTEANDTALLLASSLRRSNQILALRNSYHGRSFSTIAITGNRSWSPTSLSPFQTYYVHGGQQYRSPFAGLSRRRVHRRLRRRPARGARPGGRRRRGVHRRAHPGRRRVHLRPGRPARRVRGSVAREGDPVDLRRGADRLGPHRRALLGLAGPRGDQTPDLVTFAKGVGNGLSMGGVIAPASIMDSLGANSISTFGGSPLTSAGALANLRYLLDHQPAGQRRAPGADPVRGLRAIGSPHVGDVRGKGLMIGVELVRDGDPAPDIANLVLEGTKRRGVLIGKGGLHGNVLRIAPPLTLTRAEAEEGLAALVAAIEEV